MFDIGEVAEWGMRPVKREPKRPGPKRASLNPFIMRVTSSKALPASVRRCIAKVKLTKEGIEIVPYDKIAAIARLGAQLGMWKEQPGEDKGADALVKLILEAHKTAQGDNAKVIEGVAE
jgi:hypothetical protein